MKKTTIYIPRDFNHPARDTLLDNPPKNLKFILNRQKVDIISAKLLNNNVGIFKKLLIILKLMYGKFFDLFNIPVIRISIPQKKYYFDYYLENFHLVLSHKKILIYQLENIADLVGYNFKKLKSTLCRLILRKYLLSKRCKYIFCMSKASKSSAIKTLNIPKRYDPKFQVIYPTLQPYNIKQKLDKKSIKLLFIASVHKSDKGYNFYMKGGKLTLQAYEKIREKYNNVELIYKGYVPNRYKECFKNIPGIKYYLRVSREKLLELYEKSDIFLFPTYGDTFGFTFIEAMAHGLPIVSINNNFATPELVIDNETGLLAETTLKFLKYPRGNIYPKWLKKRIWLENLKREDDTVGVKNIIKKIELLIENEDLRKKYSENSRKRLENGDLSIIFRNKKMFHLFKQ